MTQGNCGQDRNVRESHFVLRTDSASSEPTARVDNRIFALAQVTHELRTPLAAVLGFAESLKEDALTAEEREAAVDAILSGGRHLLQVIQDYLDLSKQSGGRLEIHRGRTLVVPLVRAVVDLLRPRAEDKGVSMDVEWIGSIPESIETDAVRLRQILFNVIGNAVKFTNHGGVLVLAQCDESVEGGPLLSIAVSDSGIGIDAADQARIFEPFQQANGTIAGTFGGTGLGLSVCRDLCRQLGGDITVTSSLGRGSVFRVRVGTGSLAGIPVVSDATLESLPTLRAPVEMPRVSGRALVVDDSAISRKLLCRMLRPTGLTIEAVGSGRECVELMGESPGEYDLTVLDLQMPEMNGLAVAQHLRGIGYAGSLIGVSASPEYQDSAREAGCDVFLTKPIDRAALGNAVRSLVERRQPRLAA